MATRPTFETLEASMPVIRVGTSNSALSPAGEDEFVRRIKADGYAVVTDSRYDRSWNHYVAGVGHDDARWAENRFEEGSMAAYYENGAAFGGRWWEDTGSHFSVGVKYYGCSRKVA